MAKGKGGGGEHFIKGILPDKFANVLLDKDNKGQSMVASYAKVMEPHMFRHFETFANTFITQRNSLTPMDFVHYNTYGDYQMFLDTTDPANPKIGFRYTTLNTPSIGTINQMNFDNRISEANTSPGLYGVYKRDPVGLPREHTLSLEKEDIPILTEELSKGSSGLRLMLPSIGTLFATTYGYTNVNKGFQQLIIKVLEKIKSLMNPIGAKYTRAPNPDVDFDYIDYFLDVIQDPMIAAGVFADPAAYAAFRGTIDTKRSEDGDARALEHMVKQLIPSSTSRFEPRDMVTFKDGARIPNPVEVALRAVVPVSFDVETYTYQVAATRLENKKYKLTIFPEGEPADTVDNIPADLLRPISEPRRALEKKKKTYTAPPTPAELVAYSQIVDELFALHNYAYICKEKTHNFAYLSPNINKYKKPEQVKKEFPRMHIPTVPTASATTTDFLKDKKFSEKNCFLKGLLQLRNAYTMMILKAQRSSTIDTRVFDDFYKGDLTLKEISWLANMLSDGAKVITQKPQKINPLAQLSYVPTGAGEGVQLYGEANRRTIFYQIDIPMLKEVIIEYINMFNELTVRSAYSFEGGKNTNPGAIAKALWASIRKRTGAMFADAELIPHMFFSALFSNVNEVIAQAENFTFEPYPPNWSDTNVLTSLTIDPSETDMFLTPEELTTRLSEYLDFLFTRYGGRPRVTAAVLTTIEAYKIKTSQDYAKIKSEFMDMVEAHNKRSQLKGTNINFQAFTLVLSIMRAELAVPMSLRDDYVAQGYEKEALTGILKSRNTANSDILAYPPGHPRHVAPEEPKKIPGQIRTVEAVPSLAVAEPDLVGVAVNGTPVSFGDYKPPTFEISTDAAGDISDIKIKDGGENWREGDRLTIELPAPGGVTVTRELTVGRTT